eukprot:UN00688
MGNSNNNNNNIQEQQQKQQQSTPSQQQQQQNPTQQLKIAVMLAGRDDLVPADRIVRHFRLYYDMLHGEDIQNIKYNYIN